MATAKKYGPAAGRSVEREMKAMKAGTLKSSSGKTVTNPKQAIAIGLSEARRAGAKMPPAPGEEAAPAKKTAVKKGTAGRKSAAAKDGAAGAKKTAPERV